MTTITALTDPSKLPNQSQDQAAFDANMAYLIENLPLRAQQENALAANLNSIAAGGAYAIPFTFDTGTTYADPGAGKIRLNTTVVESATGLYASSTSSAGLAIAALLASVAGSTSFVKGHFRLISVANPSKYIIFSVTTVDTTPGTYRAFGIQFVSTPGALFANGEAVVLHFQRTGDKGDTGPMNVYPYAHFAEQYASGTNGPATGTGTINRALNATIANTITGASLSGGTVTLATGTYEFRGVSIVAGNSSTNNQALLTNITDNWTMSGTSNCGGSNENTISHISGRFVISAQKQFKLKTQIGLVASYFGIGSASGYPETYANLEIWKLA